MYSLIGIFEVTAASGNLTQTNLDSYLDKKNGARTKCPSNIDVPDYKRGGTKWGIIELCGLSMIFHLLDVSKHTTDRVTASLLAAAVRAKIVGPRFRGRHCSLILTEWSHLLQDHYKECKRKSMVKAASSLGNTSSAAWWEMISKLVSGVDDIKGVLQTTISQHASMSATISTMSMRIEGLTGNVSGWFNVGGSCRVRCATGSVATV